MEKYEFSSEERETLEQLTVPLAIYQYIDKRVVALVLSDGFCELFGYKDRDRAYREMNHDMYRYTHPDDTARVSESARRFAEEESGGEHRGYEVIYRTRRGRSSSYRIIHATGRHIYRNGVRLSQISYMDEGIYTEDTSVSKREVQNYMNNALHEESLLKASYFDVLTGLPSMTYFFELAEAGKAAILKQGDYPVLLYIDLRGMKYFNSVNGFAEGDCLLQRFGKLLVEIFGSGACSHFDADHFAVFLPEKELKKKLDKLFKTWKKDRLGKQIPMRIGVYPARMEDVPVSAACDRAKLACDSLRQNYESTYKFYDQGMREAEILREYILGNLDKAISEHLIQVYYQPIVRAVSGRVCDEEALSRWIDPVMGFLSPAEFIPILEDAGMIYKMDLYVLEQVLAKLKKTREKGLFLVPQSINLSRSDFNACDIVEEIRSRVDAAGIPHELITIEITESIIGSHFDYMKKQVERFQNLGFPVWMDDFGSGYSSLDVLQSIKFNLIKFDMGFMKKLEEGTDGRIILQELVCMATSLGTDTVCEGVEREDQVRFLQEIGCSKLQGYCFTKPLPLDQIFRRYETGTQIGFENPEESAYFDTIGRTNLFDLGVIVNEEAGSFQNFFNTLPMAIIEIRDGKLRFVRSNQSYRDFMMRYFGVSFLKREPDSADAAKNRDNSFVKAMLRCCSTDSSVFFDERTKAGSTIHSFARRISVNPVTDATAAAVAVLSIGQAEDGVSYTNIARALASDYFNVFYVDSATERFIEYTSGGAVDELAVERRGSNFFEQARADAATILHPEDTQEFITAFTKENVMASIRRNGSFGITYRMMNAGEPVYVNMKGTCMDQEGRYIILGVTGVDEQMRQNQELLHAREEQLAYARITALSGDYIGFYAVDPETGSYQEYNATKDYRDIGLKSEGDDFFRQTALEIDRTIHPDDAGRVKKMMKKETLLNEVKQNGLFVMRYRLMIGGNATEVSLHAAMVEEPDGPKLIIGIRNLAHSDRQS